MKWRLAPICAGAAALLAACCARGATNRLSLGFAEYRLDERRMSVADVSNPARPLDVCHFDFGDFTPEGLAVTNGALVASGEGGSVIFNISDIFAPTLSAVCATNGNLLAARPNIVVAGDFAVFCRPRADGSNGWELVSAAISWPPDGQGAIWATSEVARLEVKRPCRLANGADEDSLICCDGAEAFSLRISPAGGIFAEAPFFVSTNEAAGPVAAAFDPRGLVLLACRTDGIRIFSSNGDAPPRQVTRCLTAGEARDVASLPGAFAAALGTSGVALCGLGDAGLIGKRTLWPLPAGSASAVFASDGVIFAACEEAPIAFVATNGVSLRIAPQTEHPAVARLRQRRGAPEASPAIPRPVAALLKGAQDIVSAGGLVSCHILPSGDICALDAEFRPVFVHLPQE